MAEATANSRKWNMRLAYVTLTLAILYLQLLPLFRSKDFTEGVQSFLEKREPRFEGR